MMITLSLSLVLPLPGHVAYTYGREYVYALPEWQPR
jgi:hypothetical protein